MRTLWKGSISFGLVNVPVSLYTATENKTVKFRQLHKECHTPIQYQRVCPTCKREVGWEEIVRGYEYEPGRFVTITEEDMEKIPGEATRTIDIVDFVDLKEIDPIYFDRTYYLSPAEPRSKAFNLLRQAMDRTGKIAIARVVIREKQHLCTVRVFGPVLALETMFWPDEVRPTEQIPTLPVEVPVQDRELDLAVHLVENLAGPFVPDKYHDEYRTELLAMIEAKVAGEEVHVAPEPEAAKVVDLLEALRQSVERTEALRARKTG
ncbi:MAG: Ku protein [Firmicutes bacterium]|nr:Ku protein [Bacillota bacterium]